jgi:hypothetical protein
VVLAGKQLDVEVPMYKSIGAAAALAIQILVLGAAGCALDDGEVGGETFEATSAECEAQYQSCLAYAREDYNACADFVRQGEGSCLEQAQRECDYCMMQHGGGSSVCQYACHVAPQECRLGTQQQLAACGFEYQGRVDSCGTALNACNGIP